MRARAVQCLGYHHLELRSVNHRYLETTIRLPDALRGLELLARERIGGVESRQVECALKLQTAGATAAALTLNRPLVERLLDVAAEVEHLMGPGTGLRLVDVLRWPGAVSEAEPDLDEIRLAILDGLDAALRELVVTREQNTSAPPIAAAALRRHAGPRSSWCAPAGPRYWRGGATSC